MISLIYCIGCIFTLVLIFYLFIRGSDYIKEGNVTLLDLICLLLTSLVWPITLSMILTYLASECVVMKGRKQK